ncbi:MAG: phasin family protein [Candidatus Accumulibacter sp.]|nr:phasin family protein [Accumulibacter sp.]
MSNIAEKIANSNKTGVEAIKGIANVSFDSIGQWAALNLQTARAAIESNVETFNSLMDVRDLEGLKALQKPVADAALEQSMTYYRRAYEIYTESSNAIVQIVESQINETRSDVSTTIDKLWEQRPAFVDGATEGAKSLMTMVKSMFGQWQQLAAPAVKSVEKMIEPAVKLLPAKV